MRLMTGDDNKSIFVLVTLGRRNEINSLTIKPHEDSQFIQPRSLLRAMRINEHIGTSDSSLTKTWSPTDHIY